MKYFILFLLFVGHFHQIRAQSITQADSLSITQKINDWNEAWKTKDATLSAKWYANDADFTNAFGFNLIGRNAIEDYLQKVFKMDFVMAGKSEQTSLQLRWIAENTILAISSVSRKGQQLSDESELGDRKTTHHRLFKKSDDWLIIAHLISDARSTETNKH